MKRVNVSSSSLASIGYSDIDQILEVEFIKGSVYQYFNVPDKVYKGLMSADSHGKYFDRYVKKAGYRFKEVR